ncbi:MAG: hypothetical protein FWG77_01295 [Treponema sp.]|nr:hypothetical protein [Treponema sp.]
MSLFSLLWIPLFYLFWCSISSIKNKNALYELLAFLGGCIIAGIVIAFGPLIDGGGFGFLRWLSGSLELFALPAVLPLLICILLFKLGLIQEVEFFANITLMWLLPGAIVHTLFLSVTGDPILLMLIPILWAAIAVGVPFFIKLMMQGSNIYLTILACSGAVIIPFTAATSYWALFSQRNIIGFLLFSASTAPMIAAVVISFISTSEETDS